MKRVELLEQEEIEKLLKAIPNDTEENQAIRQTLLTELEKRKGNNEQ